MWDWLGEPLAADFANTTKRYGSVERECLRSGADLAEWARREGASVPDVDADAAGARLDEVRALRDAVVAVLHAARAPQGARPAAKAAAIAADRAGAGAFAEATARVNAAARAVPIVAQLRDGAIVSEPAVSADPLDELLARVAASAIEIAGGDAFVGFCDAPSCGQFFVGGRSGRLWCSDACGTRARVARHAHRHATA
jgi:predicted RNA-binding Zn ribbon-like protein